MTDMTFAGPSFIWRATDTGKAGSGSRSRLNAAVMWLLFALLLCLPLFLGGNRPMAWALSTVLLCLGATCYFAMLLIRDQAPRIGLAEIGLPAALVAVFMGFIVVQVLPVGGLLPASFTALPVGLPPADTISLSPGDTMLALLRWISIALVAYFSIQIAANSLRAQRFLGLLFWVAVAHAVYGLMLRFQFGDTILFTEKWAYLGYATGGFVNRNSFATFLAIGAVIGIVRLLDAFRQRPRGRSRVMWLIDMREGPLLTLLGFALVIVTLVATASRMGVAAGLAGMVLAAVLFLAKRPEMDAAKRRGAAPLILLVLVAAVLLYLFGLPLIERMGKVEAATVVRLQLYEQILGMISDRPWAGFGGGTFEHAYPLYHRSPVNLDLVWDRAHSSYLALWSEYGIIFGSLPMLAILLVVLTLVASYLRGGKADPLVIAAIAGTAVAAIHSTVDFSLEMHGVTLFFTALLAGGAGKALSMRQGTGGA